MKRNSLLSRSASWAKTLGATTLWMLTLWTLVFMTGFCAQNTVYSAENTEEYKPLAFTVHTQTTGPVTVKLAPMNVITELNTSQTLPVTISSTADTAIKAKLLFYSCDTVTPLVDGKAVKEVSKTVEIPAKGSVETEFNFQLLDGTYSALYPLHVKCFFPGNDHEMEVHAVRVIETKIVQEKKLDVKTVVKIGGVSLLGKSYTASRELDGKIIEMPGFQNMDEESRATYNLQNYNAQGETRPCYSAHPPYKPHGGSFFAEYEVELPKEAGLFMNYGACIRLINAPEPPSDGVTFRFWAKTVENGTVSEPELLEEIHTESTTWEDHSFSLEKYAGKNIRLVIEIHPGPKNDTTCDGCFLSGLTINTGRGVKITEKANAEQKAISWKLDDEFTATILPGKGGLLDAKITIASTKNPKATVTFDGITLGVGGVSLNSPGAVFTKLPETKMVNGKLIFTCTLLADDEELPIQMNVYPENGILVFDVPKENPIKIRNFSFKPTDKKAERVYWGHGFVAENPGQFQIGMGGHDLAASFIGMDYEGGLSLVMGASEAPVRFQCNGEKHIYTLEMNSFFKIGLVPSCKMAFNAAVKYRKQNTWIPKTAPGVERKRGRLVFDVWGGSYAENVKELEKSIRYGVTDSLFLKHVWQCWGYDVRLPDIWNTNPDAGNLVLPGLGTYEELVEMAELCDKHDIPFGVHDNYIDFYPDAEGFSYDYIDFNEDRTPRKAWINHGAGVQSYQWRPELFKPFLERNLELNRKYLPTMDAYFVDVFTSASIYEFYTRDGKFGPMTTTSKWWKDCFETIADGLSHTVNGKYEPAITVSEAGDDALLGSISGADCQWMLIDTDRGATWRRYVPCDNWSRVPWFAAVNHTNFSRHGVGYSDRYTALRERLLHDVLSDDYISAEILGGVDLMVESWNIFEGSVRKNYLAQHVRRALADEELESVVFVDGVLRHPCVTWSNGMKVYANRGDKIWDVKGYAVPKYGYVVFDANNQMISGIICNPKNKAEVVECSKRPDGTFYMNGRGQGRTSLLPICPTMKSAKVLEDGKAFEVVTNWHCEGPTPRDFGIFAHVFEPHRGYGFTPDGWYDGYNSNVPTSKWGTTEELQDIETGAGHIFRVPEGKRNGVYHVMVGLWDRESGKRSPLMGETAQDGRYSVAKFEIRDGKIVGEITPVEMSVPMADFRRLLANKTPLSLNGVSTLGAVNVKKTADALEILPLPPQKEFDITITPTAGKSVKRVVCDGKEVEFRTENGSVTFRVHVEDAKVYRVEF